MSLESRQGQICREFEVARTVLVVDDDPLVLEVTADMLKDLGCDVVAAASGMDAIERLLENPDIEILVTDLNMPGMDGYELVQRATAVRPGLQVIMLSGREVDGPRAFSGLLPSIVTTFCSAVIDHRSAAIDGGEPIGFLARFCGRLDSVRVRVDRLTPREREVFELVVRGEPNKQIARAIGCTERTVNFVG